MTYRIFATVDRGMTDKTPVCIFPWEKPLLAELHGGNVEIVTIDQLCSKDGIANVRQIKLPSGGERATLDGDEKKAVEKAPNMREQFEAMAQVSRDADPFNDLDGEYSRLVDRYGMHPDVQIPIVEKVFGSVTQFKRIVQPYRGAKPPKVDPIEGGVEDHFSQPETLEEDKAPAEMTFSELQAACKARDINAKGSREELEERLTDAIAEAAA